MRNNKVFFKEFVNSTTRISVRSRGVILPNLNQFTRQKFSFLQTLCLIIVLLPGFVMSQNQTNINTQVAARPSVGAIRWDAWTGGSVTNQVERTLAPKQYNFRLPWFAEVRQDGTVRIDGGHQNVMDQEIVYAAGAGLDYWAFVNYPDASPTSTSLRHYLSSTERHRLDFCLILHNNFKVPESEWPHERERALALLKEPGYHSVAGGRPLVYLFGVNLDDPKMAWRVAEFYRLASEQGPEPYMVYMGWNPVLDRKMTTPLGFSAVSGYAVASNDPTFAQLVQRAEKVWQSAATEDVPYVPLVTTGWDKEPRKVNPVSWELDDSYHQQDVFPSVATPDEIASHLARAIDFVRANPYICQAQTIVVYGWNEHDEGGWLCPTWTLQGPNTDRLDTIRRVLRQQR
jgi:hypothetical protein